MRVEQVYVLRRYMRLFTDSSRSCSRLGLTPLAYLWQRDQGNLLSEMIEAGVEAIIIKVAGIGLTPNHLGKTLAQLQPHLLKLVRDKPSVKEPTLTFNFQNNLYGSHMCGEGGEYESLTLDGPLFKQRIQLLSSS